MRRFIPATLLLCLVAPVAAANLEETDGIELAGHDCTAFATTDVSQICFNPQDGHVVAMIHGTPYFFCDVALNIVDRWLSAGSQAQYYNAIVDGKFACK